MTPQALKAAMEAEWDRPGVVDPLYPARWRAGYGGLFPNHDPLILDQDEGDPLDPADAD